MQISIIFGQKVQNKLCEWQKKTGPRFLFNFWRYSSPKMAPWHDLVSPGDEVYEKIFFRQTILNGPIREKNMFPKIRKIFALMTWPWLDT